MYLRLIATCIEQPIKKAVENRTQLPLVLGFTLAHGHTRLIM